jgi:molybdopterin synthase catalytic subunit
LLKIIEGAVPVAETLSEWYEMEHKNSYGAFIPFVGTIREESGISGLSFDIYEPILEKWFDNWQKKANEQGAILKMIHSKGDVLLHESSYISAVFSPKRVVALELIREFVEDFKANAPIWKYDLIGGKRIYAEERSTKIEGSGLI